MGVGGEAEVAGSAVGVEIDPDRDVDPDPEGVRGARTIGEKREHTETVGLRRPPSTRRPSEGLCSPCERAK